MNSHFQSYRFFIVLFIFVAISFFSATSFAQSVVFSSEYPLFQADTQEWQYKNIDYWLSFLTTLSALLAGFFIYSGFKINDTVAKVDNAKKDIENSKEEIKDLIEYGRQLEYCMSYILSQQFEKAIDALTVLRKESFVLKDGNKQNTCFFFLAHCYYEKFKKSNDAEDISISVEYINEAIEDTNNPFKKEILETYDLANSTL